RTSSYIFFVRLFPVTIANIAILLSSCLLFKGFSSHRFFAPPLNIPELLPTVKKCLLPELI
ncbi:MAG TPA: hypothetical protein VFY68_07030, partial [Nitrososphaeraceae archaeon]|nr:hypothetical protein [Nitrososphaeraceae archaeon]